MIVPREKHGISLATVDSEIILYIPLVYSWEVINFDTLSAATTALLSDVYRAVSLLMSDVDGGWHVISIYGEQYRPK